MEKKTWSWVEHVKSLGMAIFGSRNAKCESRKLRTGVFHEFSSTKFFLGWTYSEIVVGFSG